MEIRSKYALKFTLGILLLSALAWKIDASKFLSCLRSVSSSTFLVCSILFIIAIFFTAYKWSVLLPSIRYIKLLALSFIGHFFSVVLPGQVSGEVVKVYRLGKERQDAEHIAASVLVDKLIGLISLLVVAEGGLIASQSQVSLNISLSIGLFMLFFIISLFCLKIPFVYRLITVLLSNIAGRWPRFDSIVLRAFRFLNAWEDYLSRPLRLIYVFFLGAVFQLFCAWINTLLAH
ncbi:MAG: lysylphosphatidylglycerol synthase transmembrane domain-containing protein, partial [Flavisolibacter sp.]